MRSWSVCALLLVLLAGLAAGPAQGYPFAQVDASPTGRLFAAIDQENLAALQSALADGASLDAHDKSGHTPLVTAAAQGNAPIFRALLQAGADPNGVDPNHWAPVIQAAFSDQIDVMRVLLAAHPKLDVQNGAGWSAMSLAVNRRNKAMIELLVHAGAGLNTVNEKTQHSLLTEAYVSNDDYDLIAILRNAGATFANATDELFATAANGDIGEMRSALAAGADVNSHSSYGDTPLSVAARKGNTVAVRFLLQAGADPNVIGSDRMTALSWAIFSGHQSTITALLDGGADVHVLLQGKRTMLMAAVGYPDNTGLARYLISQGVDIDAIDISGQTALMMAAEANHVDDVKVLLAAGADPMIRDRHGRAAADIAHEHHFNSLAALLGRAEQSAATQKH